MEEDKEVRSKIRSALKMASGTPDSENIKFCIKTLSKEEAVFRRVTLKRFIENRFGLALGALKPEEEVEEEVSVVVRAGSSYRQTRQLPRAPRFLFNTTSFKKI